MPNELIEKDGNDYSGEYVTVPNKDSKEVISHGKNVVKVIKETKTLGYNNPVIIYVPEKDPVRIGG